MDTFFTNDGFESALFWCEVMDENARFVKWMLALLSFGACIDEQ
jgi:hypothetical protein